MQRKQQIPNRSNTCCTRSIGLSFVHAAPLEVRWWGFKFKLKPQLGFDFNQAPVSLNFCGRRRQIKERTRTAVVASLQEDLKLEPCVCAGLCRGPPSVCLIQLPRFVHNLKMCRRTQPQKCTQLPVAFQVLLLSDNTVISFSHTANGIDALSHLRSDKSPFSVPEVLPWENIVKSSSCRRELMSTC